MQNPYPSEVRVDPNALIRNEPVQARSTARLAALLDAAAEVISEIGYERLTTAMVADRARASIGTVYRYFPDRIALLQSLAARNADRTIGRLVREVSDTRHKSARDALDGAFDSLVGAFRDEPGFPSLRLGDVLDLRPAEGTPANSVLAHRVYGVLVDRFSTSDTQEGLLALEAWVEVADALIARAFARNAKGDATLLRQAKNAADAVFGSFAARS